MDAVARESSDRFSERALQYYVAGRHAVLIGLSPVAGNLLHHAMEMMFKAILVERVGLDRLKKLGHRLAALWDEVERYYPSFGPSELRPAIEALDQFEDLRYPDKTVRSGALIMQSVSKSAGTHGHGKSASAFPTFKVELEPVDEVFRELYRVSNANPSVCIGRLSERARAILSEQNQYVI